MISVTLKQLRTLAAVARAPTMAMAAEQLKITPPAVTIQIRLLEEGVGMGLVERGSGRLKLTAAGAEVLRAADRIEQVLNEAAQGLAALRGLEKGEITVSIVSTAQYFAPRLLAKFRKLHPKIEVHLQIANREATIADLEHDQADLAIMGRPPEDADLDCEALTQNPMVFIAAPDHPLAGKAKLALSELAGETFLLREPGSGTRRLLERLLADGKVSPKIGMEIASNEAIKQSVIAGLGIAFLSAHTIAAEVGDGRISVLAVEGTPVLRDWYVVQRRGRPLPPAAVAMRTFLIACTAAMVPTIELPGRA